MLKKRSTLLTHRSTLLKLRSSLLNLRRLWLRRRRQWLKTLFSLASAIGLLSNLLIPNVSAVDAQTVVKDSTNQSAALQLQGAPAAVIYQPPIIHRPTRTDPTPDPLAARVPAKKPIQFTLTSHQS